MSQPGVELVWEFDRRPLHVCQHTLSPVSAPWASVRESPTEMCRYRVVLASAHRWALPGSGRRVWLKQPGWMRLIVNSSWYDSSSEGSEEDVDGALDVFLGDFLLVEQPHVEDRSQVDAQTLESFGNSTWMTDAGPIDVRREFRRRDGTEVPFVELSDRGAEQEIGGVRVRVAGLDDIIAPRSTPTAARTEKRCPSCAAFATLVDCRRQGVTSPPGRDCIPSSIPRTGVHAS